MKTPETSRLFEKRTDPKTGVEHYLLTHKITRHQQGFYFVNESMTEDGRYLWFYATVNPVYNGRARHLGYIDFLTDEIVICYDVPFEGGLGRMITLTYRSANGASVTVASLYPARALSLIHKGDYTISGTAGLPLAGLRSVRMENGSSVRMHAQGADALYIVTLPALSASELRTLTSTFQLYQGD